MTFEGARSEHLFHSVGVVGLVQLHTQGNPQPQKEGKTAWDTKTLSVREGKKEDILL